MPGNFTIQPTLQNSDIRLVIFDCDGVLVDSEILCKRVLVGMLASLEVTVSDHYFDTYFLGQSYESAHRQIHHDFNVLLPKDFRDDYLNTLLRVFAEELEPTEYLNSVLDQLNVKSCIATSSSPQRVNFALQTTGLLAFFDGRITTSSEVQKGKPAPDIFLHAAAKMNVQPEHCLVIEDSQAGIEGALAAGMEVIKYTGASHLSGKANASSSNVSVISHWHELSSAVPGLFK